MGKGMRDIPFRDGIDHDRQMEIHFRKDVPPSLEHGKSAISYILGGTSLRNQNLSETISS